MIGKLKDFIFNKRTGSCFPSMLLKRAESCQSSAWKKPIQVSKHIKEKRYM